MKTNWQIKKLRNLLMEWVDVLSSILTIIGSLIVVFSIGPLSGGGSTGNFGIAYVLHPLALRFGIFILLFGFILQFYYSLKKHSVSDAFSLSFSIGVIILSLVIILLRI